METVRIDRGIELNRKRLQEIDVDISFHVEQKRFPAHRLIVSLHSDYLRTLTDPESSFAERGKNEFILQGISAFSFNQMLLYMYTGAITIREDNVFDIFESLQFLQINTENDPLQDKCLKWMTQRLESSQKIDCSLLVKMWNISETYGTTSLKKAVMDYIDCHLEELLTDNLLQFLSFDEVYDILSRPKLCARSQKEVCDSILVWARDKRCPEDEEDQELIRSLVKKLKEAFPSMSDSYFQPFCQELAIELPQLPSDVLHQLNENDDESPFCKDQCDSCVLLTTWSRDEADIRGLDSFLEERKEQQVFVTWNLKDNKVCHEIPSLRAGRSFFQHYGPVTMKNGYLVHCASFILYLGGTRLNSSVVASKRNRFQDCLSDESYVFEIPSKSWLRMTNRLPKRLFRFGALFIDPHLYIVGGLTDESFGNSNVCKVDSRKYFISRQIYRIHIDDWFSSSHSWQHIGDLPEDRVNFSVVNTDRNTLCIVSYNAVDVFNMESRTWTTIPQLSSRQGYGQEKPEVANIGTTLYVISSKSKEVGPNAMWSIDLAAGANASWQPILPSPDYRFNPIKAFSHAGCLYVLGYQPSQRNFAFKYEPVSKEWTLQLESFSGHFVPHVGVLLRRQTVKKSFFDGCVQRI